MTEKILQVSEMNASDLTKQFQLLTKKLSELEQYIKPVKQETLLSPKDVMEWLKITPPTLNDWAKKGILIRYKLGNRAFYKKEEIIKSLDGSKYSDRL
ncbi:helix-turn-helix domain-containing protein [Marinifilum sp. D737]|uniref:helix-turn-helix domain-containing protein n=1 Tax=Marinifilum sp. D737 TaxID=2969628 RepID=UPI002276D16D|nr:helix-turn-helix domain-containing protein [Marinifilum sp. D737]MCY1634395.1 helix-turn-helix domain-containing protein [Marinifilum sp. D737]